MTLPDVRHAAVFHLSAVLIAAPLLATAAQTASLSLGGSRSELTEKARAADSAGRRSEAFVIRSRLRDGDFEVGDRILMSTEGAALSKPESVYVVTAGKIIRMHEPIGDVDLRGVLRSELHGVITQRVDRYYKNVVVHVTPLLRLVVSGAVRAPGVTYERYDTPVSDVIMRLAQEQTDLKNIVVMRGQQIRWGKEDIQTALANGVTLDRLELEPGDEIAVGARAAKRSTMFLQVGLSLVTALLVPILINNRR
jgi:hypothetical protein